MESAVNINAAEVLDDLEPVRPADPAGDRMRTLTKVLRRIGTLVLLASAVTFVIQGWANWDTITRYFLFLGFTGVTAAMGIFCALRLKEDKGARTLLGVACAIIPAHFVQLGAFIYSRTLDGPANVHPMFLYQAPSTLAALGTLAVALLVLLPIIYSGFSALARIQAKYLTAVYAAANFVLLLPTREPTVIAGLSAILFGYLLCSDVRHFSKELAMKNADGRMARTMLFVPFFILILRNTALYSVNAFIFSAFFASIAVLMIVSAKAREMQKDNAAVCEFMAIVASALSWITFSHGLIFAKTAAFYGLVAGNTASYVLPLVVLPVAAICFGLSFALRGIGGGLRTFAVLLGALTAMGQLVLFGGIGASLLCIVMGITAVIGAFAIEERGLFYIGIITFAAGLLYHIKSALVLYSMSPWLTLAVIGIAVVVGASYLESNARKIIGRLTRLQDRVKSWN